MFVVRAGIADNDQRRSGKDGEDAVPTYLWLTMKIILEVPANKAQMMLDLLSSISFVKVAPLSKEKARRVDDLIEAMSEIGEIKRGAKKGKPLKQLLDEL